MASINSKIHIRQMNLEDLDSILAIDHKIRGMGKAITYANLTTERIFTIDRKAGRLTRPVSYADLITGDIAGLLEFGFVAEVDGHVRGFILGRVAHTGEAATEVGNILILGVHPEFWRKGIARQLVNALCEKYRGRGIRRVHIGLDQRDKELIGFFEQMGFSVGHLIDYSKTL
ncbi:MAG: GNAT family N-acetyltransferase [Thermodesulfobacteriota bacterium]